MVNRTSIFLSEPEWKDVEEKKVVEKPEFKKEYKKEYKVVEKQECKKENKNENKIIKNVFEKKVQNPYFIPKEKDTLFWCFYVIKKGFSAYEYPGNTSFLNEKEEKFKCIDVLRSKKDLLKHKKIKNIKEDVEYELGNKEKIGMKTFIALCVVENINILFIHKKKCFELSFLVEDEEKEKTNHEEKSKETKYHIIHHLENPEKYAYEMEATKERVDMYKNTYFKWESIDKPLKAISSYKAGELLELTKQLGLESTINPEDLKKKTKKDLYELIIQNL
jgi:hypothetical protein